MSKRGASSYLTDQNWDQEDEKEEAGEFKMASDDVIKGRAIRKAKRRGAGTGESNASGTGGIFKGFSGFTSAKPETGSGFGGFASLSNGQNDGGLKLSFQTGSAATPASTTGTATSEASKPATTDTAAKPVVNGTGSKSKSKYLAQLKALNESVARWIKEHVDKNPYCILTPIFTDYEKHLAEIEKKYPQDKKEDEKKDIKTETAATAADKEDTSSKQTSDKDNKEPEKATPAKEDSASTGSSPAPTFTFQSSLAASSTGTKTTSAPSIFGGAGGGFKFGESKPSDATTTTTSSSGFSFGSGTAAGTGIFGSSGSLGSGGMGTFGGAGGFSFASAKPSSESSATQGETAAAEEYVPPKPEVAEIKEDGAFYTKRCKLYFKKGEAWQEKGIGNLHLKPCSGKTQLIIRADTNLGNILLNIMLSSSLPMSRQGKNNVSLMCIPNPPLDEKKPDDKTPVGMLIRVKTGDDADELLAKMKEAISG